MGSRESVNQEECQLSTRECLSEQGGGAVFKRTSTNVIRVPKGKTKNSTSLRLFFPFFFARRFQRGERDWQAGDASPEERLDWPAAQRCSVGCLPKGALHQEPLIWAMITARRCGVGRRRAQRSEHVPSGRKTRQENSHILELNKRESIGAD